MAVPMHLRSWLRARRRAHVTESRVVNLAGNYTLAAYAAPAGARGFLAYAKVFAAPVEGYWDARMALAKYCGQQVHADPAAALDDAIDVAMMSLINEGAVPSGWLPLDQPSHPRES